MSHQVHSLIAHLACRDAASAVEFYGRAFGATPAMVLKAANGQLMHAALSVGDAVLYLGEAAPEWGCPSPLDLGGSGVTLNLPVSDCDAAFAQALAAGCSAQMPPQDMFWGDRYAVVADPYGHRWSFAQHVRDVAPDELQRAADEFACNPPGP